MEDTPVWQVSYGKIRLCENATLVRVQFTDKFQTPLHGEIVTDQLLSTYYFLNQDYSEKNNPSFFTKTFSKELD